MLFAHFFLVHNLALGQKNLYWISPNPDELPDQELTVSKKKLEIKLRLIGVNSINKENFHVYINNRPVTGEKFDETSLLGATFKTDVFLEHGVNKIVVKYKYSNVEVSSAPLEVIYSSVLPKLHLLSIGVTHADLKYTVADAVDFSNVFKYQSKGNSKLFSEVSTRTLFGKRATAKEIRGNVERLRTEYRFNETISEEDLIILFISSHGYIEKSDREFYLKGSDYNPIAATTTSLKFKDVLEILNTVSCKKLIFIDACESGAKSSEDIQQAIEYLSRPLDGFSIFTSSKGNQRSFESESWENGAFTEALLEAFSGSADSDKNSLVTINELEKYIKSRVPEIVLKEKNEIQNPEIIRNDLGNLPIFNVSLFNNSKSLYSFRPDIPSKHLGEKSVKELYQTVPVHEYGLNGGRLLFHIGKYEVTNEAYCVFLNENLESPQVSTWIDLKAETCKIKFNQGKYRIVRGHLFTPVVEVTWKGAIAFSEWLSRRTESSFRLPTSKEWEIAAKAGQLQEYSYLEEQEFNEFCWSSSNSGGHPHNVGSRYGNMIGAFDMLGNVWEWCEDDYTTKPLLKNLRGGSWFEDPEKINKDFSFYSNPKITSKYVGFRLIKTK